MSSAEASGERGIAVGESVNYSTLIAGDHNVVYQTIVGRYPALKDYAYDFSELINTITSEFVGREFVFQRLEEFQQRNPCGYLRIAADAGLGKTVIAAEVAHRYKAPAFFTNANQNLARSDQCLNHLSAELIARLSLAYDHIPDRAGENPLFLGQVLAEAAQKASGPLWIVVDALDEADKTSRGQNTLLLPGHLPHGVYFLLTHRPGEYPLATDARTPVGEYTIAWDAPAQKTDIRTYLRSQAAKPAIQRALAMATPPISEERFITVLEEASEGNFQYLDYVNSDIADIASREPGFVPLNLDTLPKGLKGYYEQFWSHIAPAPEEDRREVWEEWEQIYRPVIAFLGAAREPVTAEWLAALVGCPERTIRERVLRRWQRFLHQDQEQRTWRVVHRSFTDFVAEKMDEADWRAIHARIADRYLAAWGGLDQDLPMLADAAGGGVDGSYGLRHLTAHLEGAGRIADLHRLLQLERWFVEQVPDPRPGLQGWLDRLVGRRRIRELRRYEPVWFVALDRGGQTEVFLGDVARAWRLAEGRGAADQSPRELGLQCRYALITASINSLAEHIPITLLTVLVTEGYWDTAKGLSYARQITSKLSRAQALAVLAPRLTLQERDRVLAEALAAARTLGDEQARARALAILAPRLTPQERDRALAEALAAAQALGDGGARARALAVLAPHLTPQERDRALAKALAAAQALGDEWARSEALAALAPHLTPELLAEALAAARAIGDEGARAWALAALAPHLTPKLLAEALTAARAIKWDWRARSDALAALASRLAELGHPAEALAEVWAIEWERARAAALASLAPHLTPELLAEALAAARALGEDRWARYDALAALAPHLTPQLLAEALTAVQAIKWERARALALAALAPHLTPQERDRVLTEALAAVRAIKYQEDRSEALAALAPHLTPQERDQVLTEALGAARALGDEQARARALTALAPHLTPELLANALAAARAIKYEGARARALAALAPHLTPELLAEALAAARALGDEWGARARALAALAPRLAELGHPAAALAAAREIGSEWARSEALAALAPHLTPQERDRALAEALAAARAIGDEGPRSAALAALAPHLTPELLAEALAAARAIGDEGARAWALAILAPRLTPQERDRVLAEALAAAQAIGDEGARYKALAALAPHLTPELLAEALAAARAIGDEGARAWALAALAPHLTPQERDRALAEALAAARAIGDEGPRSAALAALAPHLTPKLLAEALAAARRSGRRVTGPMRWRPGLPAGGVGPSDRGSAGDRVRVGLQMGPVPGAGCPGPDATEAIPGAGQSAGRGAAERGCR